MLPRDTYIALQVSGPAAGSHSLSSRVETLHCADGQAFGSPRTAAGAGAGAGVAMRCLQRSGTNPHEPPPLANTLHDPWDSSHGASARAIGLQGRSDGSDRSAPPEGEEVEDVTVRTPFVFDDEVGAGGSSALDGLADVISAALLGRDRSPTVSAVASSGVADRRTTAVASPAMLLSSSQATAEEAEVLTVAVGCAGSGKTTTLFGGCVCAVPGACGRTRRAGEQHNSTEDGESRAASGLLPRVLQRLFFPSDAAADAAREVAISVVEVREAEGSGSVSISGNDGGAGADALFATPGTYSVDLLSGATDEPVVPRRSTPAEQRVSSTSHEQLGRAGDVCSGIGADYSREPSDEEEHEQRQSPTGCFMADAADLPAAQYVRCGSPAATLSVLCAALAHSHAWEVLESRNDGGASILAEDEEDEGDGFASVAVRRAPAARHRCHLLVTLISHTGGGGRWGVWKLWDMAGPHAPPADGRPTPGCVHASGERSSTTFRQRSHAAWCAACVSAAESGESATSAEAHATIAPALVWATARRSCSHFVPLFSLSRRGEADAINEELLRCAKHCAESCLGDTSGAAAARRERRAENLEAARYVVENYAIPAAQYLALVRFARNSSSSRAVPPSSRVSSTAATNADPPTAAPTNEAASPSVVNSTEPLPTLPSPAPEAPLSINVTAVQETPPRPTAAAARDASDVSHTPPLSQGQTSSNNAPNHPLSQPSPLSHPPKTETPKAERLHTPPHTPLNNDDGAGGGTPPALQQTDRPAPPSARHRRLSGALRGDADDGGVVLFPSRDSDSDSGKDREKAKIDRHRPSDGSGNAGHVAPRSNYCCCCCDRLELVAAPHVARLAALAASLEESAGGWMRLEARTLAELHAVVQSNIGELEVLSNLASQRLGLAQHQQQQQRRHRSRSNSHSNSNSRASSQERRRSLSPPPPPPALPATSVEAVGSGGGRGAGSVSDPLRGEGDGCAEAEAAAVAAIRAEEERLLLRLTRKVAWLEGRLLEARQREKRLQEAPAEAATIGNSGGGGGGGERSPRGVSAMILTALAEAQGTLRAMRAEVAAAVTAARAEWTAQLQEERREMLSAEEAAQRTALAEARARELEELLVQTRQRHSEERRAWECEREQLTEAVAAATTTTTTAAAAATVMIAEGDSVDAEVTASAAANCACGGEGVEEEEPTPIPSAAASQCGDVSVSSSTANATARLSSLLTRAARTAAAAGTANAANSPDASNTPRAYVEETKPLLFTVQVSEARSDRSPSSGVPSPFSSATRAAVRNSQYDDKECEALPRQTSGNLDSGNNISYSNKENISSNNSTSRASPSASSQQSRSLDRDLLRQLCGRGGAAICEKQRHSKTTAKRHSNYACGGAASGACAALTTTAAEAGVTMLARNAWSTREHAENKEHDETEPTRDPGDDEEVTSSLAQLRRATELVRARALEAASSREVNAVTREEEEEMEQEPYGTVANANGGDDDESVHEVRSSSSFPSHAETTARLCEAIGFLQATAEQVGQELLDARGRERAYLNTLLL